MLDNGEFGRQEHRRCCMLSNIHGQLDGDTAIKEDLWQQQIGLVPEEEPEHHGDEELHREEDRDEDEGEAGVAEEGFEEGDQHGDDGHLQAKIGQILRIQVVMGIHKDEQDTSNLPPYFCPIYSTRFINGDYRCKLYTEQWVMVPVQAVDEVSQGNDAESKDGSGVIAAGHEEAF